MTPVDALRAVLKDALEEQGFAWMVDVAQHREQLWVILQAQACSKPCSAATYRTDHNRNLHSSELHHDPTCVLGILLRAVGGAAEAERQMNSAHAHIVNQQEERARREALPQQAYLTSLHQHKFLPLDAVPANILSLLIHEHHGYLGVPNADGVAVLRVVDPEIRRWIHFVRDSRGGTVLAHQVPAQFIDEMLDTGFVVMVDGWLVFRLTPA